MRVFYRLVATMLSALVVFLFLSSQGVWAAGPTVVTSDIVTATTWSRENSPYIVSNTIAVNAPLVIDPGVVVKFNNNATNNVQASLAIRSDLSAIGTVAERIVFTSICDDGYGGDTQSYSSRCHSGPVDSEWGGISFYNTTAQATIEYALIFRASRGISYQTNAYDFPYRAVSVRHTEIHQCASGIVLGNTMPLLSFNVLEGNTYGLEVVTSFSGRIPVIRDSTFINNGVAAIVHYPGVVDIDARYNWWGDATGPYFQSDDPTLDNSGGLGNRVIQSRVKFRPWLESEPDDSLICAQCASNILFLPGIKGSKLYRDDGTADGDTLWLPTALSNDTEELQMDVNGQSLHTVYTKDVLATVPFGSLYQSFLQKLEALKTTGTINDYQSFAYDWRNNVEDIISNRTLYPLGVLRSLVTDAEVLARNSKTRKITIIAHSNGGLLAKALMLELEKRGLEGDVETVVFVGTPQLGTPLAVLSLLYGYDEPIPALISQSRARTLAENMPGAYGLLPSEEYFNRMTDPLITFSSEHTRYKRFRDVYGEGIGDYWELYSFLHADDDGRSKPAVDDIEAENVLNDTLLYQAWSTHNRLDTWVPPSGVKVIQIAGWGIDTVSGVDYTEKSLAKCYYSGTSVPSCVNEGQYEPVYDPQFTVDGDKVVVTPSALMQVESENVKRYWVNLRDYNDNNNPDRKHRDLLEVDSVQALLARIMIRADNAVLPPFVQASRPDDYGSAKPRLRMALYSPLDIHLYDTHGNHTGPKKEIVDGQEVTVFEEGIPNSYYYQFGEHKYVGWSEGEDIQVEMDGYDLGAYTLNLKEVKVTATGEEEMVHTTFENLPTTADTTVKFSVPGTGLADMSPLVANVATDDGVKQYSITPVLNGTATYEEKEKGDTVPPVTTATMAGAVGMNDWYTSDVAVTLAAADEDGGSGVDKMAYSLDAGATWNTYTEPLVLSQEGTTTVQYFSTDKAGNKEEAKAAVIKIDKTAPEGKIAFNSTTQKLDITGMDTLGGTVSVVVIEQSKDMISVNPKMKKLKVWFDGWLRRNKKNLPDMLATLTDDAGHTTSITFEKTKDRRGFLAVRVRSLGYDGNEVNLTDALAQYKWRIDGKNQYRLFAAELRVGNQGLESHYIPKKNETWIMEKPRVLADDENDDESDRRPILKKLPGMIIPTLQTEQGSLRIDVPS